MKTAVAAKKATPTTRAAPDWQLAGVGWGGVGGGGGGQPAPPERPGATTCGFTPASPPSPTRSPCVWTGKGSGRRTLEHRDGCICRSVHLPAHPFALSQPAWAHEDIKVARGNIVLWGLGGVEEGYAPPPPHQTDPGGVRYASATRSAAQGPGDPGAVRVVAPAGRAKAAPPPV